MKKIGIDLDSTMNNLEQVWLERYNLDFKDNLKEWYTWDVHKYVKKECGKKIYDYLHEPNFFYNLDIKPNVKEVIDFLSSKYELYVPTAYSADTCLDKVNWIKKHNLNIKEENVIFINNKSLLDLDYLIDDGPHNFNNFKGIGLVFDQPYNRWIQDSENRKRVYNWKEIYEYFVKLC